MSEQRIELITIGDEILLGHTLDTNSHWIAGQLSERGLRIRWHSTVGDYASDLRHQIRRAWNRADFVLLTGGLGPTPDDITRSVICRFFEDELDFRSDIATFIDDRFASRGLKPPFRSEIMAQFPSRAEPILNSHGNAPGIHYNCDNRQLFAMPGVPVEMKGMMTDYVLPILTAEQKAIYRYRLMRTTGIGESHLHELIGEDRALRPVKLAYLPSIEYGVTLRLSLLGSGEMEVGALLDEKVRQLRERVGKYVYTEDSRTLDEVILEMMRVRSMKLTVAESCTGGLICHRLVSIPGSSDVFERGFVTYSNSAKIQSLGVDPTVIETHGAVSEETAEAMAKCAREKAGVDVGLSVTGIAGPSGGTKEKPVGLVYCGIDAGDDIQTVRYIFSGNRDAIRQRSALAALNLLWWHLQ